MLFLEMIHDLKMAFSGVLLLANFSITFIKPLIKDWDAFVSPWEEEELRDVELLIEASSGNGYDGYGSIESRDALKCLMAGRNIILAKKK